MELRRHIKRLAVSTIITVILAVCLFAVTACAAPLVTVDLGSGDTSGGQFGIMEALMFCPFCATRWGRSSRRQTKF